MFMVIDGKASIDDFDFRDAREMNYVIHETLEEITRRMKAPEQAGADGAPWTMNPGCGSGGDGGGPPENPPDSTPGSSTIPFIWIVCLLCMKLVLGTTLLFSDIS